MAEAGRQMSGIAGQQIGEAGGAAVRLAPAAARSLVNLRGRLQDAHLVAAVWKVLGVALPESPNRWNAGERVTVLWLGPDEWLLMAPDGEAEGIEAGLREAVGDDPWLSVVDVSHNYTGLTLSGPASRQVLAKGCPLDLHDRSFGPGACAQTLLAHSRVLLRAFGDAGRIEIWVRNSFARYTASWLVDAMAEFGENPMAHLDHSASPR